VDFEPPADETRASQVLQHDELVRQGLALLDENERCIAELVRGGYTWQEIADQLATTREAVRKQFYRAVNRLRQRLFGSTTDDIRPQEEVQRGSDGPAH
jgi:DNA-directed RNA polymerase specialized sigma24 family protein